MVGGCECEVASYAQNNLQVQEGMKEHAIMDCGILCDVLGSQSDSTHDRNIMTSVCLSNVYTSMSGHYEYFFL